MARAWTLIATLVLALSPVQAAAACLSYGPPVQLTGWLHRKTVPGADKAATYWILRLDRPACVDARPGGGGIDVAYSSVREVQLVLGGDMHQRYAPLLDARVTGNGTLFGRHTAHHATPVLLTVRELRRADAR
ncbi:DUF4431 domain-containing protein [Azospirillum sp. TSO22-1]|uniref:DUF4431 domain-containing protein n=1 Tax=Azospirillum sp. TSO22-1 TaxID=716789 RepID=UPI000D610D86|nr:DUF4431 domain-containing protein [Azospirillum sp. TSO22-1]PWC54185.1 hypothetical protein TSO221_09070 [Azospirillum sp. TSO22-1]